MKVREKILPIFNSIVKEFDFNGKYIRFKDLSIDTISDRLMYVTESKFEFDFYNDDCFSYILKGLVLEYSNNKVELYKGSFSGSCGLKSLIMDISSINNIELIDKSVFTSALNNSMNELKSLLP